MRVFGLAAVMSAAIGSLLSGLPGSSISLNTPSHSAWSDTA